MLCILRSFMQKKLLNFKGLYGDQQQPFAAAFVHHESLQTRSRQYNWDINEHLHTDLFQVFVITSGNGLLISEHKKMTVNAPCILLIPNNTLHGFVFQSDIAGEVLTFSESLPENVFKHAPHILLELHRLRQFSFEYPSPIFDEILFLTGKIASELMEDNQEKQSAVQVLFQWLWISLYRESGKTETPVISSDNRVLQYFQTFRKLIRQSLHEPKSIGDYARALKITPVHLNRICQALVQKTALQVVHEYQISEAKKYLMETSFSVSEVSYLLDFKDPAHFSKLFKKYVGVAPGVFRKRSSPVFSQ